MIELHTDNVPNAPAQPSPAEDVAFKARALAQAHPLTDVAFAYRADLVDRERSEQPVSEVADWAASAFLVGYCVRRVEETESGRPTSGSQPSTPIDRADVVAISQQLSDGQALGLLPDAVLVDVLDRVIATEIDKRNEHVREQLDAAQWKAFEDYVAWWVLHGWAARVVERPDVGEDLVCGS